MAKKQTVTFKGNDWTECQPLTADDLQRFESTQNVQIPEPLKELLSKCNGGFPTNPVFANKRIEVEIGRLLPITPPPTFKGESLEAVLEIVRSAKISEALFPFAYDNGNAGIFCVSLLSGEVIYWVHDEPEDPLKKVAPSLEVFLAELESPL